MIRLRSYRKQRSYIPTIIVICIAVILGLTSPFYIRPLMSTITYPFQLVFSAALRGVLGMPSSLVNLGNLASENVKLKAEIKELNSRLTSFNALAQDNASLRLNLNFRSYAAYNLRLLPAIVIGRSTAPWFSIVEVNQGSRQGVRVNQPAVTPKGLAGRVIEVRPYSSLVQLLNDPDTKVPAVDSRSRDLGVVTGQYTQILLMKYVGAGAEIQNGDLITTSQVSQIFPPGIPIGKVKRARKNSQDLFYHIEIIPVVDFSKLEDLYIAY